MIYLDTSAYLGVLLHEKGGEEIRKVLADKPLCSSTLLILEAERNLVRMNREGILEADGCTAALAKLKEDTELFFLKDLSLELCLTSLFPPVQIPRSNDLVHLRTARWFQDHGGLEAFLTLDVKQRRAAQEFGQPLISA